MFDVFFSCIHTDVVMLCSFKSRADFGSDDVRLMFPRFSEENFPKNLAIVDELKKLGKKYDLTSSQVALAWILAEYPTGKFEMTQKTVSLIYPFASIKPFQFQGAELLSGLKRTLPQQKRNLMPRTSKPFALLRRLLILMVERELSPSFIAVEIAFLWVSGKGRRLHKLLYAIPGCFSLFPFESISTGRQLY